MTTSKNTFGALGILTPVIAVGVTNRRNDPISSIFIGIAFKVQFGSLKCTISRLARFAFTALLNHLGHSEEQYSGSSRECCRDGEQNFGDRLDQDGHSEQPVDTIIRLVTRRENISALSLAEFERNLNRSNCHGCGYEDYKRVHS